MVSTIRFRSFKNFDLQTRRPARVLVLFAAALVLIAWMHQYVLVVLAYSYLASAFVGLAISRLRHRGGAPAADGRGSHTAAANETPRSIQR
jgi:CDP-diacylglycerol--serine O-phosphatidyltransferase